MSDRGWTPRRSRKGGVEIYCSPRCGLGCTRADYNKAHKDADALALRLGHGWTTNVWENLGWHFRVVSPCGRIEIGYNKGRGRGAGSYSAGFGAPDGHGRNWWKEGKTPEAAIKNVARVAVAELHGIGAVILDMPSQAQLTRARRFLPEPEQAAE
jgi:hypothetical protein